MNFLVTGSAGFIGFHLSKLLLNNGKKVIGIDNLNDYYDVNLKKNRLKILKKNKKFIFFKLDIANKSKLKNFLKNYKVGIVIHLAAQAGVRYSITNPETYLNSNIIGFFNILEICKQKKVKFLYFASTSSVYGDNNNLPYNENLQISKPLQFYAATKVSNEVMAFAYSNIYKIKTRALRFFTVYGPYGRPDMAIHGFVKKILLNQPINMFNRGNHTRDFTYIEDITKSIYLLIKKENTINKPKLFDVFNLGNQKNINIKYLVKILSKILDKKIKIKYSELKQGEMKDTLSNSNKIIKYINYKPNTNIEDGLRKFIKWYKKYYKN